MVIGIIGGSLAGLVAGSKLARAGHEVTVIERAGRVGGRMATFENERGSLFDYGHAFFPVMSPEFGAFVNDMQEDGLVTPWSEKFGYYDGTQLHEMNPNRFQKNYFAAPGGMQQVAHRLSRWVDLKLEEQAGGLTHIGANRTKKRAWMINLTDISVFECDAVILANPAPEAYGILQTAQDETPARRIIRHIDEIRYRSDYTLMASYEGIESPEWFGVECDDPVLDLVINESGKRDVRGRTDLVIRSDARFARKLQDASEEEIVTKILERTGAVIDHEFSKPDWNSLRYWKYSRAINPLDESFMELEMEEAPLALVGDYLGGNTVESAYLSGKRLADYWIEKYEADPSVTQETNSIR